VSLSSLYTTEFVALRHTDAVGHATAEMLRHGVTDLPIVDDAGKLVGLFKLDRLFASLLPKGALMGHGMDLEFVGGTLDDLREHMHRVDREPVAAYLVPADAVREDSTPIEVVLLLYRGANAVPVVDAQGTLVGMVSARELLSAWHA
jgi:CBS-domain-containing membrane protein